MVPLSVPPRTGCRKRAHLGRCPLRTGPCVTHVFHTEKGQGCEVRTQPSRSALTHRRPPSFTVVWESFPGAQEGKRHGSGGSSTCASQERGWSGETGPGARHRSRERCTDAPFTSLGSTGPGPGGAAYSGSAICLRSAEISTGGLGVGRLFHFLNAAGSAQDVTPVSRTGDGGEKCLGKQGRKKRNLPCSRRREGQGVEKEGERKRSPEGKRCGEDGLGVAARHHASFPAPQKPATAGETGLLGPKVTGAPSAGPLLTSASPRASAPPPTFLSRMPNVKRCSLPRL